jgi:hypothetical protein
MYLVIAIGCFVSSWFLGRRIVEAYYNRKIKKLEMTAGKYQWQIQRLESTKRKLERKL